MGREARRAQERADRRQKQREASPGRSAAPALTAPSSPSREDIGGGSPLKPRWALDIISELRKVTWPSRRETLNLTGVVITVSLALGVLLGGADLFFGWLIQNTLLR